jgi:hypothetical protein
MSGPSGPINPNCVGQGTVTPVISVNVAGQPVYGRLRGVSVNMGQAAVVQWTMTTPAGDPVDLTNCFDATFEAKIREVLSFNRSNQGTTLPVTVVDLSTGLVS